MNAAKCLGGEDEYYYYSEVKPSVGEVLIFQPRTWYVYECD